jgi:hypothetical protein
MAETFKYLGIEYRDGGVGIEGPMTINDARRRTSYWVDKEGLPVTSTWAKNPGEAIIKIMTFIINHQKINKLTGK